ncbi:MAG: hypothetical protein HY921_04240 [Elusimicrobia bacterium]|nr:hypothetical protein [Elusimicrobiota bacterium]
MDQRPVDAGIEDARQFAARLEVGDTYGQKEASLEDLALLLALFARARTRLDAEHDNSPIKSVLSSTEELDN